MAEHAFIHIPKNAGSSFRDALQNTPQIKYFGHDVMKRNVRTLKKIFILREPIDRFTSAFFYAKNHLHEDYHRDIMFNNPNELLEGIINFNMIAYRFFENMKYNHHVDGVRIHIDWVFEKQCKWFHDPWKVILYDKLDEGIDDLNDTLNINIELPHRNKSKKKEFEYSEESINLLNILYKEDFELYEQYTRR